MKLKNLITLQAFLLVMLACKAQDKEYNNDINKKFGVSELKEDLKVLKNELSLNHPGLYNYTNKKGLDSIFNELEKSIDKEATSIEFFRKIGVLNSFIKDAHTQIFLPREFNAARNSVLKRFPFALHYNDNRLFVLRNLSKMDEIKSGWEVLSINGLPVQQVVSRMLKIISRDGYNKTAPIQDLNHDFSGIYATVFGCPDTFDMGFKVAGKNKMVTVDALLTKEMITISRAKYKRTPNTTPKPLSYKIDGTTAFLTITSFEGDVIKEAGQNYKKTFKNLFNELDDTNVKNLVIDIRNNLGGWAEVGDELLSYLIPISFHHNKNEIAITNKIKNKRYYDIDGYVKHFERLRFKKDGEVFKVFWNEPKMNPKSNLYKGSIFVLINGKSASQAGEFSGLLKDKTAAVFVGEETGGNPNVLCGGNIVTFVLPNSRIKAHIPLRKSRVNINFNSNGHGVVPDYEVSDSWEERFNKEDVQMDKVLELIKNER